MEDKIKSILSGDMYIVFILIFIGFSSFGLGRLSMLSETKESVRIIYPEDGLTSTGERVPAPALDTAALYVASRNSDKYHLPWCSGAQRISEANKVWFASKAEAEAAGYTPASNCEGI